MSRHHVEAKWSRDSQRFRALIKPLLPMPCARCGRMIEPTDKWDVGHVDGIDPDHRATLEDLRPEHSSCNRSSGGREGAAIRINKAKADRRIPKW